MIKLLKFAIHLILGAPIYLIAKIIPKKKGLYIIGSNLGRHFADNPKYYYLQNYSERNLDRQKSLIWISKNRKIVDELNSKGLPATYLYTLKGIWTVIRAETAFISHQLKDINGPLMGGATIVQLWHAMALRKVGYGGDWHITTLSGKFKNFTSKWLPYAYYMTCDKLLVPCEKAKENSIEPFSKSFRNGEIAQNMFLARQPRTVCFEEDFLLTENLFPEKKMLNSLSEQYNLIISWLPTQRRQLGKTIVDVIEDSQLDLNKLDEFCKKHNYIFVIKAHFLDYKEATDLTLKLDNILVYPHADPYPLLRFSNVLITDYSSVFFDFLLVNRPIIFMAYDLEEYEQKVKFYYEYEKLEIGPICKTWDMVLDHLVNLDNNEDAFSEKRQRTLKDFNFVMEPDINFPIK
ncbi:MAG: CDP-glycerol glycerophosphotransferase family protein [Eudoraea sp.]|nr:CDP-glycerol glycerophosphotransferase family protein [Eudoraea sp.]